IILDYLLNAYPRVTEIVTDFTDGSHWLNGNLINPKFLPKRQLLEDLAAKRALTVTEISTTSQIPFVGKSSGKTNGFFHIFKAYAGGFRFRYLLPRIKLALKRYEKKRIYIYTTQGLSRVCLSLAEKNNLEVFCDRPGLSRTTPLRYEHILPLPSFSLLKFVLSLNSQIKRFRKDATADKLTNLGGISFKKYISDILSAFSGLYLLPSVLTISQCTKFLSRHKFDKIIINGEGSINARAIASFSDVFGHQTIFIEHSNTLVPYGYRPTGRNFENVIYIAQGQDHIDSYGSKLPKERKPFRPVLTNPTGLSVLSIRGKRSLPPKKRILLTNFSGAPTYSVARIPFWDKYLIDIFSAARHLISQGYQFTYRGHPGYGNPDYIAYMLDLFGIKDKVCIDNSPSFSVALTRHDLFVSNVSDILYQGLFAGWPAVFYEPSITFKRQYFVGLPAATDIEAPIAVTPEALESKIKEGITMPESLTAQFPKLFNTIYAGRFLGEQAENADTVLADFIADNEVKTKTAGLAPGCAKSIPEKSAQAS
ncbi:MAG: hypothetical protein VW802_01590, partial [Rhodospirillaceae bacterium]